MKRFALICFALLVLIAPHSAFGGWGMSPFAGSGGGGGSASINDSAGNGDSTVVWSADKVYDQLALKQDADSDLTWLAGQTLAANVRTFLGYDDFAAMRTGMGVTWANLGGKPATPAGASILMHGIDGTLANATSVDLGLTTGKFWQGVASKAAEVNISERIGATFVGTGAGGVIEADQTVFVSIPYAVASIDSWTVICDQDSGATGIVITPYSDAYVEDDIALTTMCTSGVIPHTSDGATAGGTSHQAAWDCNITSLAANSVVQFKVTTAPTAATSCSITLKVTR